MPIKCGGVTNSCSEPKMLCAQLNWFAPTRSTSRHLVLGAEERRTSRQRSKPCLKGYGQPSKEQVALAGCCRDAVVLSELTLRYSRVPVAGLVEAAPYRDCQCAPCSRETVLAELPEI